MADELPSFSIVVATHNRPAKLRALLESIRVSRTPNLEMVIVVDDSNPFQDLSDGFADLRLKHIHLQERVFQSRARNIGWPQCPSPFIYFIDDDNVVTRTTLEEPLRILVENPALGAVMPAVLIEAGFMSHPVEGRKIFDPGYRRQMAKAIVDGLLAYKRAVETAG